MTDKKKQAVIRLFLFIQTESPLRFPKISMPLPLQRALCVLPES